jgi:hypothetical protein
MTQIFLKIKKKGSRLPSSKKTTFRLRKRHSWGTTFGVIVSAQAAGYLHFYLKEDGKPF